MSRPANWNPSQAIESIRENLSNSLLGSELESNPAIREAVIQLDILKHNLEEMLSEM